MTRYKQTLTQFDEDGVIINIVETYMNEESFKNFLKTDVQCAKTTIDKVRLSYYYENGQLQGYALTNHSTGYNRLILKEENEL